MSKFRDLHMGTPSEAIAQLQENDASNDELRAALCNCLSRIERLESQVDELRAAAKPKKRAVR